MKEKDQKYEIVIFYLYNGIFYFLLDFYQNNMKFPMCMMLLVAICALFANIQAFPTHTPGFPDIPGSGRPNPGPFIPQPWPQPTLPKVSIIINIYIFLKNCKILDFL